MRTAEVSWEALGLLITDTGLSVTYGADTNRAAVAVTDDYTVWAHVGWITLTPTVPGAYRIQQARLEAIMGRQRGSDTDDPAPHELTAELERQGRPTDQHQ